MAGRVNIEDTCTLGTIVIRGVGYVNDQSDGTVIDTDGFVSQLTVENAVLDAQTSDHTDAGTVGKAIGSGALVAFHEWT